MEKSIYLSRISKNLQNDRLRQALKQDRIEFYNLDKLDIKKLLEIIFKIFKAMNIEDEKFDLHDEYNLDEIVGFVLEKTTQVAGKDSRYSSALTSINECLELSEHRELLLIVLDYLLERFHYLKERSILAKFLAYQGPDPQYLADEEVFNAWENYKNLQDILKKNHSALKAANKQRGDKDLNEIRKDQEKMRSEIENLQQRIASNNQKIQADSDRKIFEQVTELQKERDEKELLLREFDARKNQLEVLQVRFQYESRHLEQLKKSVAPTPADLIMNVSAEYRQRMEQREELLQEESQLNEKKALIMGAERDDYFNLLENWGVPRDQLEAASEGTNGLHFILDVLNQDVKQLTQTAAELDSDPEALKARSVVQKQIGNMNKQLQGFEADVKSEQDRQRELKELTRDFESKIQELEHIFTPDTRKVKSDLKEEMKQSLEQYKKLSKEYESLRAHTVDLQRTKILLETELQRVSSELEAKEDKAGVSGFTATHSELQAVSTKKSEIDEIKGQTLVDYSDAVDDLRVKINEKRAEMEGPLREVKELRTRLAEVKEKHTSIKSKYDAVKSNCESQRNELERNVKALRSEMSGYETRFYQLTLLIDSLRLQDDLIKKELKNYTSNDPSVKRNTLREMYNARLNEQVTVGKRLRARKKELVDNERGNVKQREMWQSLKRLLEVKADCLKKEKEHISKAKEEYARDDERLVL